MLILSYPVYCNDWRNKRIFEKSLRSIKFEGELCLHAVINSCKYPKLVRQLEERPNTHVIFSEVNSVAGAWAKAIRFLRQFEDADVLLLTNQDVVFASNTLSLMYDAAQEMDFVFADSGDSKNEFSLWGGSLRAFLKFAENDPDSLWRGMPDEKFLPAYFEDNDLKRRIDLSGLKRSFVPAKYKHVGSSVIRYNRRARHENRLSYERNKKYYLEKWGGEPDFEEFAAPFGRTMA